VGDQLLEREPELAALARAVRAAASGRGAVALVSGPAGIGKTRLLDAACETARGEGLTVLRARGDELEREFPFGIALQLFVPWLRRASDTERSDALSGPAAAAAALLGGGGWPGSADGAPLFTLLHGLYWLVGNLAERRPVLLAADDLHTADQLSLRFLVFLAQRVPELAVVVAGAFRTGEPEAEEELLRRLRSADGAVELRPAPLSAEAVNAIVRARRPGASGDFAAACEHATRGNPYLLDELLADLAARGVEPRPAEVERIAPERILDGAVLRLARLGPTAGALARAVAVLGDDARLRHAAALAGVELAAAAPLADALRAADVLRAGERLGFVHPLMRAAVAASIPRSELAAAHLQAARELAADGAPAEAVGAHLALAPHGGDAWVVGQLRAAASSAAAKGALETAVALLRRALDEPPPVGARVDVLVELGEAESLAGLAGGVERLDGALALVKDLPARAELRYRLGWTLQKRGDIGGAVQAFARGLEELGDGAAEPAGDLALRLRAAHLGAALLDPDHAGEAHAQALPGGAVDRVPRTAVERGLVAMAATHLIYAGTDHRRVIELSERAWADGALLAEEGADSPTVWHVIGCLSYSDALDVSERAIAAVLRDVRPGGSPMALALAHFSRSWPNHWRGRAAAAVADAEAAVRAWSGDFGMYLPMAAYWRAISLIELDERDGAQEALRLPDASVWEPTPMYGGILTGQGTLALERGRPREAVELLEQAGRLSAGSVQGTPAVLPWRAQLALSRAASGDLEGAREQAAENLELCRRFGAPRLVGEALRVAGTVAGGEPGVHLLDQACELLARSPSRLEHARAIVALGGAERRAGRRARARDILREGISLAQGLGAVRLERRAQAELEIAGGRPRRRAVIGLDALTPSERRVAELAAEGFTNREIAQQLFVTVKAVQFHLGNTYRKLGLSERSALGPALRDPTG
jgi:DNA-binding CsgD family transcriptional regulator